MAKIDWVEARASYVYNENTSYSDVAKKYGIAKSSVQRHANKNSWQEDRWEFHKELRQRMCSNKMEHILEKEELQLKLLQNMQYIMTKSVNYFIRLQNTEGRLTKEQFNQLFKLYRFMHQAIMLERTILGLRNRVIRTTESKASYESNLEDVPLSPEERANEFRNIEVNSKSIKEILERLEKYRNNG